MKPATLRPRLVALYAGLLVANAATWGWALIAFRHYPLLLGTALLAYGLGLRHAVDADHIAAIDAVTRKLMQAGQRPLGVGLAFSLGHSSIVVAATVGIALAALSLHGRFEQFREIGSTVGTLVSAGFLLVLAGVNLAILRDVWRRYRRAQRGCDGADGEHCGPLDDAAALASGAPSPAGLLSRALRPLFAFVTKSWHMYPVGVLFGLGFDTATEIGLLAIAAAQAGKGLPLYSILVFPALFTAGMTLVDSTDNVLMVHAYGWAMDDPKRKLYYNASITFVSALVAIGVGGVEALGLLSDKLALSGGAWNVVADLNGRFGELGYGIVATFIACWIGSVLFHRWRRPAVARAR